MIVYVDILFINMKLETFMIEVNDNTNLKEAKQLVLEKSFVYPEEQVWFLDNIPIKTLKINWKLAQENKSKFSIIVNNLWYSFKIKNMTGTIIDVNYLSSRDKISTIKYHIYQKTGMYPESYCLYYKDKEELKDYEFIGKYFIPNNAMINLVLKMRSGLK